MQLKTIFSALALSTCFFSADAQQIFRISQFTQHNFLYNPAAAGANEYASIGATYRKMWTGIAGGPETVLLFGDKYFEKQKTGVGIALYSDKTGPTSRTGGQLNLSYSVKIGEGQRIMLGLSGQVLQYKVDMDVVSPYLQGDAVLESSGSVIKGDAGAGIYLQTPTLNLGASVQQIIQPKLKLVKDLGGYATGRLYRHYFFMASYNWKTDGDNVLIPNALVKYEWRAPLDVEAGARLEHKDFIWVGFNYHYQQGFAAYAGVKIDHKLSIGYAYDQFTTPLSLFDEGGGAGHELTLRYFFVK